ncbi:fumarylacetoacetate hydrolase family protein [Neobacillus sp. OS1-2]|uniref:fumarylacetoacetate hydrolase family protein n=1 Tax=Neobacillus sp. OS1-2 TaxID=3070680 RepID=UPI0027E1F6E4|nr:fumarylacetoacetate hydrolase family protein [Neobacillus sp. OS1-2]WML39632.1 fumarylacetoacetate hydrolase family protein [Neobacillus sp. OS1-2]
MSLKLVNNIFCVGRNYAAHAKKLNNDVPKFPMIFSKPTHALVEAAGQEIVLPGNRGSIHFETEIVIKIGRPYEKGMEVDEIVESMAIGIDFTLRDVQSELKKKGHPWLLAKGFPNSAIVSRFIPFPGVNLVKETFFSLQKNGAIVQQGNSENMIFDLQTIIEYITQNFGLGEGDIIYTGTPEGVGPVIDNDHLVLKWGDSVLGECKIKMPKR